FFAAVGGTFALSYLDEEVYEFFLRNHSRAADKLADLGVEYGEPRTVVILTGGVYVVGLVAQNEWLRESAVILTGALLPAGLIQTAAKITAGRARPHLGFGHDSFEPFRREEAYYSFVSGHTMVAMATSHVFAKRIDNTVAKVGLYTLGALAGTSRMYNEDHWLSDVVLGSALAIASVNNVAKLVAGDERKDLKTGLQWRVQPYGRGALVSLEW
ncbi:MAG: phosphatase PAP2 family protein, partial [candidate division KSB1 bacterium]